MSGIPTVLDGIRTEKYFGIIFIGIPHSLSYPAIYYFDNFMHFLIQQKLYELKKMISFKNEGQQKFDLLVI